MVKIFKMEVDFHHRQYHNRIGTDVTVRSLWKVVQGKYLSKFEMYQKS